MSREKLKKSMPTEMNTKALGSETVFLRQNDRILLCFAGFRCFEILGYG